MPTVALRSNGVRRRRSAGRQLDGQRLSVRVIGRALFGLPLRVQQWMWWSLRQAWHLSASGLRRSAVPARATARERALAGLPWLQHLRVRQRRGVGQRHAPVRRRRLLSGQCVPQRSLRLHPKCLRARTVSFFCPSASLTRRRTVALSSSANANARCWAAPSQLASTVTASQWCSTTAARTVVYQAAPDAHPFFRQRLHAMRRVSQRRRV